MSNYAKSVSLPDLKDVLDTHKKDIFDSLNCVQIGVIDSFNATNQTAEIKIVFKKIFENKEYEYPALVDCPVVVLGGQNSSLRFPIKKGDGCIVLFNDVNIDDWFEGTINKIPESNRKHDLSDGIAIVGIRNLQNIITDYDNDAVQLNNEDTLIRLKEKIRIANVSENLKNIIDDFIDELASTTVTITSGSSVGTYHIDNSVAISAFKSRFGALLE